MSKYLHLFAASEEHQYIPKAACGARVRSRLGGDLNDPQWLAEFCARNPWAPPVCPKCAAVALILETAGN